MDSQTKQVSEYASRMDDYDKKFEENSRKFGTLLAVSVFPRGPWNDIMRVTCGPYTSEGLTPGAA